MGLLDLHDLPEAYQVVAYIVLAVSLGIAGVLTRLGFLQGKKTPAETRHSAQVAAVIVDSSSLDRLTAAVEGINVTLLEINATGKMSARATSASARSSKELGQGVAQLSDVVDKLRDEIIRAAAKME